MLQNHVLLGLLLGFELDFKKRRRNDAWESSEELIDLEAERNFGAVKCVV
jgi:hypothetical protein